MPGFAAVVVDWAFVAEPSAVCSFAAAVAVSVADY